MPRVYILTAQLNAGALGLPGRPARRLRRSCAQLPRGDLALQPFMFLMSTGNFPGLHDLLTIKPQIIKCTICISTPQRERGTLVQFQAVVVLESIFV